MSGHEKLTSATITVSLDVPAQNSVANITATDVIGNKSDTISGNSIVSVSKTIKAKTDLIPTGMQSKVYPTGANNVVLSNNGAWAMGTLVQVIPASTVTSNFVIDSICPIVIDEPVPGVGDTYEIALYQGASDIEIGRVRFYGNLTFFGELRLVTTVIPANARVRAALMSRTGAELSVSISVGYHTV